METTRRYFIEETLLSVIDEQIISISISTAVRLEFLRDCGSAGGRAFALRSKPPTGPGDPVTALLRKHNDARRRKDLAWRRRDPYGSGYYISPLESIEVLKTPSSHVDKRPGPLSKA